MKNDESSTNDVWGPLASGSWWRFLLATLLISATAILCGILLGGCGGEGADLPDSGADVLAADAGRLDAGRADVVSAGDATGPGLGRTDAGLVFCAIPSPTGDPAFLGDPVGYSGFLVLEGDVRAECEAEKAPGSPHLDPADPYSYIPNLAGTDCSDVAHAFAGTTGVPWCVGARAMDGTSTCDGTRDGSRHCLARGGITPMKKRTIDGYNNTYDRRTALCTPAGVFAGWLCL